MTGFQHFDFFKYNGLVHIFCCSNAGLQLPSGINEAQIIPIFNNPNNPIASVFKSNKYKFKKYNIKVFNYRTHIHFGDYSLLCLSRPIVSTVLFYPISYDVESLYLNELVALKEPRPTVE